MRFYRAPRSPRLIPNMSDAWWKQSSSSDCPTISCSNVKGHMHPMHFLKPEAISTCRVGLVSMPMANFKKDERRSQTIAWYPCECFSKRGIEITSRENTEYHADYPDR